MRRAALLTAMAAVGLAACATGSGSEDPAAMASRRCSNFARAEGARPVNVDGVEPAGGQSSYRVRMRVEDGLARRLTAECLYDATGDTARWASPLPQEFVRR